MDVITGPLKMGMGGVALMADAPSATIWGVTALPKRVASVGVIVLTKFIAAQQVAPTCPKRMEFARYMVEHEFAKFVDVQRIYFSPECAKIISKTRMFALQSTKLQWSSPQSMKLQWWGKTTSAIGTRT
jgi:hypothetical protein